jgi:hypothetical protein
MVDYIHNVKKYFTFSNDEIISMVLIILIYGAIIGFNDGSKVFDMTKWFYNLLTSFLMMAIVIITHEVGRKLMAIKLGYTVEFKPIWLLIILSAVIGYFSNGVVELLFPATGIFITMHEKLRSGKFRYGHSYYDNAFIGFFGCYANILMALFLKSFSFLPNQDLILRLMMFNIYYGLFNLVPFDILFVLFRFEKADTRKHWAPMDGSYIFYSSRLFGVFALATMVITALALFYMSIFWSLLLGLGLAVLTTLVYGIFKENVAG